MRETAAALKESLPSRRVIILTTFVRAGYLRRAMEGGAAGFMLKDAPPEELAAAIRRVMSGERVVDLSLAASGNGATAGDVAGALYLSEGTVRNYLSTAIKKTGSAQPHRGGAPRRKEGLTLTSPPCPRAPTETKASLGPAAARRTGGVGVVQGAHSPNVVEHPFYALGWIRPGRPSRMVRCTASSSTRRSTGPNA
jgi:two-component system response regulator DesR